MRDFTSFVVGFFVCLFIMWLWKKMWTDADGGQR
jgi:uncharacterized membrane protein YdcZ (DUF606 family)